MTTLTGTDKSFMLLPLNGIRPKVLIADDHALFAEGLAKLLEPDFEVAAIVTSPVPTLESMDALTEVTCTGVVPGLVIAYSIG